ncbi:DUF6350 family protein [Longispora sp. K20-0274]|uniref:cell division protein PerM n=1 Tax=Longispora sp. K20-0274 TaxID=3088255 RepID=UPI003999578F
MDEETYTAAQRDTVLVRTGAPAKPARKRQKPVSVLTAAAVTSGWAALISFAPVIVLVAAGWLLDGSSAASVTATVRFGAVAWLLGHGVPAQAGDVTISLTPLALTGLVLYRLVRAGAHTARGIGLGTSITDAPTDTREVAKLLAPVIGAVAAVYAMIGGLTAAVASTPGLTVSPLRAAGTTGLLAAVTAGGGALAESGLFGGVWRRVPRQSQHALRTAVVGVLLLYGAGAATAGVATAVTGGAAGGMFRSYSTGVAGQAGLTVLCLVYAPTVAIWAVSYLVGPGFAFGVDTVVSPLRVELGALPGFPILSGLPDQPVTWVGGLAVLVPLAATALAGALLARRSDLRTPRLAKAAILAGIPAAVICALLAVAASGSLGAERLTEIGPSWWRFGLFGGLAVAVGAPLGAVGYRLLRSLRRR